MKRFLTLLILIAATVQMSAQTPTSSRRPIWVGLDMGGIWQASDMKGLGGIGWSFTMSRYSKLDKKGPLYFGWRFRFLDGRSYGYNYHRLYGLSADPVMSTGSTDYNTPTANNDGYVFSNYKFRMDEFAYELIVGSNGLRKHGVLLYAFGGIGATHWKTTTNQLDFSGNRYDYSGISTGGNDDILRGDLDQLWMNGDYETVVNGSASSGKWGIMPSAGVGFGYQFGNAVALGVEHRTTWARNDNIDGVNHNGAGLPTPNNDLYNYDGFFVRWTFGGNSRNENNTTNNNTPRPDNPNNHVNNNPTPPNNTTVVTPPNNNNPVNTNPTPPNNNVPALPPPTVQFTTPNVNPYTATVASQQLVVRVLNVTSSNQISLVINNQVNTNFGFNPSTHTMVFSHNLQAGTNVYQVTATNSVGSASDVQTILYKTGSNNNSVLPPQVTITNPASNPYTSATQSMTVTSTVINVTSVSNIQVSRNGTPITNFSFDPNTHVVSFTANLQTGSNLYEVIGTNSVGSASDNTVINYNPVVPVQPPVVTITSPASCPFSVKSSAYTINANITNVTAASQVAIIFNGNAVTQYNFTAMQGYAQVSFPVTLVPGVNPFSITGTNTAGTNSKSCEITYKVTVQTPAVPPTVVITSPSSSPYASTTQSYTVKSTVLNVNSQNEITVKKNNVVTTGWTYNMSTHVLTLPTMLNTGNNVFNVTASNANGSDSKSTTITYQPVSSTPVDVRNPTTPTSTITITPTDNPNSNNNPQDPNANNNPQDPNTNSNPQDPNANNNPQDPNSNSNSAANVVISLVSPATTTHTTSTQSLPISMTIMGVLAPTDINVRVNNVAVSNFNYNMTTHLLTFNASLVGGSNTVQVGVMNSIGTAGTTLNITYAATGRSGGNTSGSGSKGSGTSSTPKSSSSSTTKPASTTTPTTEPKKETKPKTTTTTTTPAGGRGNTPTVPTTTPSSTTPRPRQ